MISAPANPNLNGDAPAGEAQPLRYQPLPPPSITPSPAHPFTHSSLSPADLHLLSALSLPDSDMVVAGAHCGLDYVQLLLWLDQPHVRHFIKLDRRLRKLRREIRDDAYAASMSEVLADLAHTAPNPVDRRRAATTLLRAIVDSNRPHRSRVRKHAERAPELPDPAGSGRPPSNGRPGASPDSDPERNHAEPSHNPVPAPASPPPMVHHTHPPSRLAGEVAESSRPEGATPGASAIGPVARRHSPLRSDASTLPHPSPHTPHPTPSPHPDPSPERIRRADDTT